MVAQQAVNDIWICKDEVCAGLCDTQVDLCQYLIIGCDAVSGDVADVVYTNDNGGTWTNTAAQPFGNDENIESVVCFSQDKTTTRWMVVRGVETGTPTNPLEIAYSDDGGATWTNVDVEAAGTRYANDAGALFVLDPKHIWLVSTGGYIFFSSDGGVTWTAQDEGTVTTQNYNAVKFANSDDGFAVADSGIVVRTIDGGTTWTAVTAITATPNVLSLFVFDKDNVVVGDANGDIWRSWDGGTTWTQIYTGSTAINDMDFANPFVGYAIDGTLLLRTRNGGEDWETVTIAASLTELNAVVACDENNAFVVGEDGSNLGIVLKVSGSQFR